ncbi:hypothetical protein [Oricola sp.]|uniref:hypothetical protein n=1 Tax=Oricola sp. TaxID=1979950 RepID=UPI0025F1EF44|nr:hypothetical protein [Oricola sp.]MCI5075317.1 hypothetical protein [Oricola sp.]
MTMLTGEMLRFLTAGRTHVLERNGKPAFVYLAEDGTGHMKLDTGETRSGRWRLTDDGYATEWDSGHAGEWRLLPSDDGIEYVSRDGAQRLKMLGVFFGDSEGLAA